MLTRSRSTANGLCKPSPPRPPRAPDDWSITGFDPGSCSDDCTTLAVLLADPAARQTPRPLAKPRRQHIHRRASGHLHGVLEASRDLLGERHDEMPPERSSDSGEGVNAVARPATLFEAGDDGL